MVLPSRDLVPVTADLAALADQTLSLVSRLGLILGGRRLDGGGLGRHLDAPRLSGRHRSDRHREAPVHVAGRHLLGIERGAEAQAALPGRLLGLHGDRERAAGHGHVNGVGRRARQIGGQHEGPIGPRCVDGRRAPRRREERARELVEHTVDWLVEDWMEWASTNEHGLS